jgi:pSer/pThr/pTyr-binding forkhead associated (FHA) protein
MADLSFEWFVFLLRVVFIFLLYFFIFQVVRVISRELRADATRGVAPPRAERFSGGLLVTEPGESNLRRGDVFDLEPVTVVGRHPRATIVVDSAFMSSEHAQISFDQDRWWIADLNSTNGTFVNGARIRVATGIRLGDTLEIGGVKFQLVA